MEVSAVVQAIISRHDEMKTIRAPYETDWRDLMNYILPRRSDQVAPRRRRYIYDSTATDAAEILAAALHGMLTNPYIIWFYLYLANEKQAQSPDVKVWLQEAAASAFYYLAQSNFASQVPAHYLDLVVFATGYLYLEEDDEIVLNFQSHSIWQVWIAQDRRGFVDTVHRELPFTARQMHQKWGNKCSQKVLDCLATRPNESFKVLHAVFPRADRTPGVDAKGMKYASYYIELESKHQLSESGYRQLPTMCPRWFVQSGEVYGSSCPGMTALPDVRMLQEIVKSGLKAQQKAVDPPVQYPDSMSMNRLKLVPGGANSYRSGSTDQIHVIGDYAHGVPLGLEVEERWRRAIREKFLNNQLQLGSDNPQMTAEEVITRKADQLRILGPTAGRLFSDLLSPMIDRILGILMDKKLIPPPPPSIAGTAYNINYVSPIARAQKATEVEALTRFLQWLTPFGQIDPTHFDIFNVPRASRIVADSMGVPSPALNSPEELAAIQEQRAQAQQTQEGVGMVKELSSAAKNMGGMDMENIQGLMGGSEPLVADNNPGLDLGGW